MSVRPRASINSWFGDRSGDRDTYLQIASHVFILSDQWTSFINVCVVFVSGGEEGSCTTEER